MLLFLNPAAVGMKEKKNASAFSGISNNAKGGVREEEKPEAGSAALRNPAFRPLSFRSGFQDTSPILLCTGLEKSLRSVWLSDFRNTSEPERDKKSSNTRVMISSAAVDKKWSRGSDTTAFELLDAADEVLEFRIRDPDLAFNAVDLVQ